MTEIGMALSNPYEVRVRQGALVYSTRDRSLPRYCAVGLASGGLACRLVPLQPQASCLHACHRTSKTTLLQNASAAWCVTFTRTGMASAVQHPSWHPYPGTGVVVSHRILHMRLWLGPLPGRAAAGQRGPPPARRGGAGGGRRAAGRAGAHRVQGVLGARGGNAGGVRWGRLFPHR